METFTIGGATVTRIEESYEPNFDATMFFKEWRPELVEQHRDWMLPGHYDPASGKLKLSIHSWLVKAGGRTILIDACVGIVCLAPLMFMTKKTNDATIARTT